MKTSLCLPLTIIFIFLCTVVEGEIGKHSFISIKKTWIDAQSYCRLYYTDLSFVSSQSDQKMVVQAAGGKDPTGWIGLNRDPDNTTAWMWSGGGIITYRNWDSGQPNNANGNQFYVCLVSNRKWNDAAPGTSFPFYCININVVNMKMAWEEALEHCRKNQSDLPSLLSETELLQAQNAVQKAHISDPVWIGLRYLSDHWLWVKGDPLVYENWPQGDQDHQCPIKKRCGALTTNKGWENRDCQDKLAFICI
uniref:C-type lectin domain-containing protein n=1 Tax=Mastacembelus armatus TaxID=205130 RepID=A0A3Q3RGX0_9TELE